MKQPELIAQLTALGLKRGGIVLVHTSFRKIRPIEGGIEGLIEGLLAVLGPEGTLIMPSMSNEDDEVFFPRTTSCRELGVVADTFWRLPGVRRSDSPHAFAAIGPYAERITAPHPYDIPHGLISPVGRVYELGGQVLLLGVGHEANTTIHLAEQLVGVRYRQKKHVTLLLNGKPARLDYAEIGHCGEKFTLVDQWLAERGLQNKGSVGHGLALLCWSQDIVRVVSEHLTVDEFTFLHPPGVDQECDEARASIGSR